MKIVIDLQGGQGASRNRGIGRYSLSVTKAILENKKQHEIIIVLSSLLIETVELVRDDLKAYINEISILVWNAPNNVSYINANTDTRRINAQCIRETFLASLKPDIVLVTSLFEGFGDEVVTSIGLMKYSIPTAVILYDLIPLLNPEVYLAGSDVAKWYAEKLQYLQKADLLLSISESSRKEALTHLNADPSDVVNIGAAADAQFKNIELSINKTKDVLGGYSLSKDFLMYTGGVDHRKNIEGLIRSYALLKQSIREQHQLAIICAIDDAQKMVLNSLAKSVGLKAGEVILTGYIPDHDLIALYNLCHAFIFPSWHEGFGLPALEAMCCGAPVIAANTSSLPEVLGFNAALFDPHDDADMAEKIQQVLTDELFREKLLKHHKQQIKKFSWGKTAKKTIVAFEALLHKKQSKPINKSNVKKKLAYISPLPPQRSGIADYSAELLPSLIAYYDIDVIVEQASISDDWIHKNCTIHDVKYFTENSSNYERVLYHFGNSSFHNHMFNLLYAYPGVVVLHDFFLSGVINYMGNLNSQLYYSHGYKPFTHKNNDNDNVLNFPANKKVLDHAKGIIVHSKHAKRLANKWYGGKFSEGWNVIPLLRAPPIAANRAKSRKKLKIPSNAIVIASFGLLDPTKQNQALLDAWLASRLSQDENCYLIFVGENNTGEYGINLKNTIERSKKTLQIKITGWLDTNEFIEYLNIADIAVQLRTLSRGETSAAILDCMNYAIPTIINANGAMAEINDDCVYKLRDEFTPEELVNALEDLYHDQKKREALGLKAKDIINKAHAPDKCALKYFEAIEGFYNKVDDENDGLLDAIVKNNAAIDDDHFKLLADSIAKNHPYKGEKNLFIDVSELVNVDVKTGIQRVVRSILYELLLNPPLGYRVEPVYATTNVMGYKYANNFTHCFLSIDYKNNVENNIDFKNQDIFLGLDLQPEVVISQSDSYKMLRANGVKTYFVVYDLLPILQCEYFHDKEHVKKRHSDWLKVISKSSGALCISQSVENELTHWINEHHIQKSNSFKSTWFHLGADLKNSVPTKGIKTSEKFMLQHIAANLTFLMVGTIEARKGHKQVLASFEKLWQQDIDVNLVIIGQAAWLVDELITNIKNHTELNKRLIWLEGISDEYLDEVYKLSSCLIAASEGEGFGLPLIEAAQHKLPIIARDLPVFREVAGKYAYYFNNDNNSEVIVATIINWLALYEKNAHPKPNEMPWLTWEESTEQLLKCLNIN